MHRGRKAHGGEDVWETEAGKGSANGVFCAGDSLFLILRTYIIFSENYYGSKKLG